MGLANSMEQNFQYEVFKNETLNENYSGISKMVRDRMNDPNYYNSRLKKMAHQIRKNIKRHTQMKRDKLGEDVVPFSDEMAN